MSKTRRITVIAAALAALAQLAPAADLICYVRGDGAGNDANSGADWNNAFATIQKAVDQLTAAGSVTVNIQASTGGQTYYVASKTAGYIAMISLQGGWSGSPPSAQDSYSTISDTNGPIDQPGFVFLGNTANLPHTGIVCRVNFTNVTYGVYMMNNAASSGSPQFLFLSNCSIAAQTHGVFMDHVNGASTPAKATLLITNSTIRGGLSGIGDGIRLADPYTLTSIGADVSVSSAGGVNLYAGHDDYNAGTYSNLLKGTFGPAAANYDVIFGGRQSVHALPDSSTLTRPIAVCGGAVSALAQNSGRPLGVSTTELNAAVQVQLSAVSGVSDTLFGPVAVRNGQSVLWVKGVTGGGTWTADSLTRANRATLLMLGSGGAYGYALAATDMFRIAGAPAMTNGMVAPYLVDASGNFLKHDPTLGFTTAAYTLTNNINSSTSDKVVLCNAVQTQTVANAAAHALFFSLKAGPYNLTNGVSGPYLLTIGSGGLSASYAGGGVATYIWPNLKFGVNNEKEALLFVGMDSSDAGLGQGGTLVLNGSLNTTNGLTKSGFGVLRLSGDSSATLSGPITVNGGSLQLNHPNALPSGLPLAVFGSSAPHRYNNAPIQASYLDLFGNSAAVSQLTLSDYAYVVNTVNGTTSTLALNGNVAYNGYAYGATIAAPGGAAYTNNALVLDLGNANRTFSVADVNTDGLAPAELSVAAQVTGTAGLTKTGPGRMDLSATNNTFGGGIIIQDGILTGTTPTNTGVQTPFGDVGNAITLTNTGAMLYNNPNAVAGARTDVGSVTFAGGTKMWFSAPATAYQSTNSIASLNRTAGTRGVLLFQGSGAYPNSKVTLLATTPPAVNNGMAPAWFVNRQSLVAAVSDYVTYDPTLGFKIATYEVTSLAAVTAAQKANITAVQNVTANKSMWALKTSANITTNFPWTLTIGSGGLLFNGTATIWPTMQFGVAGADEALVCVDEGVSGSLTPNVCGTLLSPIATTGGLTKFGGGILALNGDSGSTCSGPVWVQAGVVSMGHANALGSTTGGDPIYLQADARLDIRGSFSLARPIIGMGARASSITTGSNLLTIAAGGSLTPGAGVVGTMQVEDMEFRGTYNWDYSETGADLIRAVNLTFGGAPGLNVNWVGAGPAPALGIYEVFRYYGDTPSLGAWTVHTPITRTGTLSVDAANKRILLTVIKTPLGTTLFFR